MQDEDLGLRLPPSPSASPEVLEIEQEAVVKEREEKHVEGWSFSPF